MVKQASKQAAHGYGSVQQHHARSQNFAASVWTSPGSQMRLKGASGALPQLPCRTAARLGSLGAAPCGSGKVPPRMVVREAGQDRRCSLSLSESAGLADHLPVAAPLAAAGVRAAPLHDELRALHLRDSNLHREPNLTTSLRSCVR